ARLLAPRADARDLRTPGPPRSRRGRRGGVSRGPGRLFPRAGPDRLAAGRDRFDPGFLQRRLGRSEARERDAVRRARDVLEAELVAEADRLRLAAVLSADTHLDVLHAAAALDGDAHELADAALVDRLERVALEHAVLEVAGQELALGVVAREAER